MSFILYTGTDHFHIFVGQNYVVTTHNIWLIDSYQLQNQESHKIENVKLKTWSCSVQGHKVWSKKLKSIFLMKITKQMLAGGWIK